MGESYLEGEKGWKKNLSGRKTEGVKKEKRGWGGVNVMNIFYWGHAFTVNIKICMSHME